jgi:type IV pilus assembly protein PilE
MLTVGEAAMRHAIDAAPRRGFTLPELTTALVAVAILAASALPTFVGSLQRGRRAEAVALLDQLQQGEERWRSEHGSYATTLADAGIASALSPSGYYTVAIVSAAADGFVATASSVATTAQAGDRACRVFTLSEESGEVSYGSTDADGQASTAVLSPCWGAR